MNKIKNSKKATLILSLLLLFLVIGAASAADDKISNETISTTTPSTDEVVNVDNDEQVLAAEDTLGSNDANDTLSSVDNVDLLSDDTKSLNDLSKLVKATPDELTVEDDYKLDSNGGLVISKSNFVLDFNNHYIDVTNEDRTAITVNGDNVTIKNLKMSGNLKTGIWTIVWNGANGKLSQCEISSISSLCQWFGDYGIVENIQNTNINHGFYWYGKYGTIRYANINNNNNNYGRFIYGRESSYLTVHDVNLKNHWTTYNENNYGIFLGINSKIYNCNFNHVRYALWAETANEIYNCNFTNQTGELTVNQPNVHIHNCIFEDSTMDSARRPIYGSSRAINCLIEDCVFKNTNTNYVLNSNTAFGMTLKNCNFTSIKSNAIAGGAGFKAFENCKFEDCNFTTCFTPDANPISLIKGCNFINVNAPYFYNNDNQVMELDSCNFNNVKFNNFCLKINSESAMYRMYNCVFNSAVEYDGFVITSTISGAKINEEGNTFNNVTYAAIKAPDMDTSKYTKIYVSPDGVDSNSGLDEFHPITFDTAFGLIDPEGEIILLKGTYDIHDKNINKKITLQGKGAIINNNNQGYCFGIQYSGIVIKNITFMNNGKIGTGGSNAGVFVEKAGVSMITIDNCTFINNQGLYAGVLYSGTGDRFKLTTISNCIFKNNTATSALNRFSAGALMVAGQLSRIVNCTFEGNHAQGAGAIYAGVVMTGNNDVYSYTNARDISIEGCTFKHNYATATSEIVSGGYGGTNTHVSAGAVVFNSPDGFIFDCTFENNTAYSGGAVYLKYCDNITKCTFINNHAIFRLLHYIYTNKLIMYTIVLLKAMISMDLI